ncbi:MAG: hypothetical protein Q8928_07305 [Bacteroidota bacterium]|nr:hypothetical protein [Bacteroidota bacterium]
MNQKNYIFIFFLLVPFYAKAIDFYVAPDGSDKNDGSIKYPFASLERARDEVRDWHGRGYKRAITVFLRGGTYYINHTFVLTAQDSGFVTDPVVYTGYKKEKVFLNGGISIPLSNITPVTDVQILNRFKPDARKHIIQVNLNVLGVTDYGQLHNIGHYIPYSPSWMELFVNKCPFQLARWPNVGFVPMGKVLEKGATFSEKDKPLGKFVYESFNPPKWSDTSDIWISGGLMRM